jgi:hypothetical protein
MKQLLIILFLIGIHLNSEAIDIVQYQYWYDSNYSNNTVVNTSPTNTLDLTTALVGASGLNPGVHTVNFRAKDTDGKWSTTIMEQFYATGNWNIDSYEYWFDNDYTHKTTQSVSSLQTYILTTDFNTSAVGYGLHALNFRAKDNAGKWSIVFREYFFKNAGITQLINAEYWIDNDFANKQAIAFTSGNEVYINQSVLTTNLNDQLHTFNFRMQDQSGKWSVVTSSYFMSQSLITGYDYWFDDDFINKTSIDITPTNLLTNEPDFNAGALSNGSHIVNFRAKNSSGKYSSAISQSITVSKIFTDAENNLNDEFSPKISAIHGTLVIDNLHGNSVVRVFDAAGRLLVVKSTSNAMLEIAINSVGIYNIQIHSGKSIWVRKMIINP